MEEKCKNCRYFKKLYVPPLEEFELIPKDAYVCGLFYDEGEVQYLGFDENGMCEMFIPIHEFPEIEGEMAEMLIDGVWIKGKIVNGYRFRDGIVTIEDDYGQRYWCGQNRTWEYRKYEEKKD